MISLKIRQAKSNDKKQVLSFCENTFSWGDYIANVWDLWIKEGRFLVLEADRRQVGICHASFAKSQVWIEGLRVDPAFRRRKYASRLVLEAEKRGRRRHCKVSRMLIAKENKKSLRLAKSLGYRIEGVWWLYYAGPAKVSSQARLVTNPANAQDLRKQIFSESWKWYRLDGKIISSLVKKRRIVRYKDALGIWNDSEIDSGVLQIGYLQGRKRQILQIVRFVQNKAYRKKSRRVQILAHETVDLGCMGVERRMPFCLMRKDL